MMITGMDVGVALIRVGVGGAFIGHGCRKLFGGFGGSGLEATASWFESLGLRPGRSHAIAAGMSETGAGLMFALGAATPLAGSALAGTMAVATASSFREGFFSKNGYELPAVLGLVSVGIAVVGAGRLSVDHVARSRLANPSSLRIWLPVAMLASVSTIWRMRRAEDQAIHQNITQEA